MTKEEAKQKIAELVAKYQSLSSSDIKSFHEAKTKQGFIEPLFRVLGWDFDDVNEVAPEEAASKGRVDYAFKLNEVSQFYLEAKPLKADLTNPEYIKQAVTYAYNKGVTWAILTDFRELRLFNAQKNSPFITLNHEEYVTDFDKLWLLSRESLQSGLLNKAAASYGALPPSIPIETRLFRQLRQWREDLYNQLHSYNESLSFKQIDEMIERLFNRMIFIRTCEDRNIEEKRLRAVVNQWQAGGYKGELIKAIQKIFYEYDNRYDSELFTKDLIDDSSVVIINATLESIVSGLYEVGGGMANYDFSIITADVLGRVYEQYLGYVANIVKERTKTAQSQFDLGIDSAFEIVAKKKYRKEQGIYYTPQFVTDYIVRQTVGRFIKDHSYNEIRTMKVLDPACGSGSFLIRAYDELLSYHAKERGKSLDEFHQYDRLPILTGNIFGVDLDVQAVEIARLNLLLRTLTEKGKLPLLSSNIRQGNSLISGTEEQLESYFGEKWREKKPFSWEQEFEDIMARGGFDIVIGNPPYVGFHGFREDKDYLRDKYETCQGRFDLYLPFIEKGIKLLKDGGLLGFICPTNFTKRQHGQTLREFVKKNCKILEFVDFQDVQIFGEALNYTGIFIFEKAKPASDYRFVYTPRKIDGERFLIQQEALQDGGWVFRDQSNEHIVAKIQAQPHRTLGELTESISEGIVTGKNHVFLLSTQTALKLGLEKELIKPAIQGKQIKRYVHEPVRNILIYPYQNEGGHAEPIREADMTTRFRLTWQYLFSQRKNLTGRRYFDASPKTWYELWCERSFPQQACDKIIVPELASNNRFAYCSASVFYLDTACGLIPKDKNFETILYLLGVLNSSLLEFYYKNTTVPKASGFYIYKTMFLRHLPIRTIDFSNPAEKKMHDDLVALVNNILELNKKLADTQIEYFNERDELHREIARTDREIDNLVYDLYGLTEEDRKIVEEAVKQGFKGATPL